MADAIVNVNDAAAFKAEVEKDRLTVVHFWASWAVQVNQSCQLAILPATQYI